MSDTQFPKHCRCCFAVHTAETWVALRYIGAQDDGVEVISIRLCTCGTSLAIVLGDSSENVTRLQKSDPVAAESTSGPEGGSPSRVSAHSAPQRVPADCGIRYSTEAT